MTFKWNGPAIEAEVGRLLGAGLKAATLFVENRVKEILSVPAPRRIVTSRAGVRYYVATTPATPGEPPRKLSGRLRASVTHEFLDPDPVTGEPQIGRIGTNVKYGRPLEYHKNDHAWLNRTMLDLKEEIAQVLLGEVT